MNTATRQLLASVACGPCAVASAQTAEFLIDVTGSGTSDDPAVVEVWAQWDPPEIGFAATVIDIELSEGTITSGQGNPMDGITNYNGTIWPTLVDDAELLQLAPGLGGNFQYGNPIWFYTLTWETTDRTPRTIDITVTSHDFLVYTDDYGNWSEYAIEPGHAVINIVPAPIGLALLGLAAAARSRHRSAPCQRRRSL